MCRPDQNFIPSRVHGTPLDQQNLLGLHWQYCKSCQCDLLLRLTSEDIERSLRSAHLRRMVSFCSPGQSPCSTKIPQQGSALAIQLIASPTLPTILQNITATSTQLIACHHVYLHLIPQLHVKAKPRLQDLRPHHGVGL